jgi:hypothetical protein
VKYDITVKLSEQIKRYNNVYEELWINKKDSNHAAPRLGAIYFNYSFFQACNFFFHTCGKLSPLFDLSINEPI